jgi:hypothetical protein
MMTEKKAVGDKLLAALDAMAEIVDDAEKDMPQSLPPDYGQGADSDTIAIHRYRTPIFEWRSRYDDQLKERVLSLWRYHRLDLFPSAWGPPHWKPIDAALTATLRAAGQSVLALDLRTGRPQTRLSCVVDMLRSEQVHTDEALAFLAKEVESRACEDARLASAKAQCKTDRSFKRQAARISAQHEEIRAVLRRIVAELAGDSEEALRPDEPVSDDPDVVNIVRELVRNARQAAMEDGARCEDALRERPHIEPLYYNGTIALLGEALELLRAEIVQTRIRVVGTERDGGWSETPRRDVQMEQGGREEVQAPKVPAPVTGGERVARETAATGRKPWHPCDDGLDPVVEALERVLKGERSPSASEILSKGLCTPVPQGVAFLYAPDMRPHSRGRWWTFLRWIEQRGHELLAGELHDRMKDTRDRLRAWEQDVRVDPVWQEHGGKACGTEVGDAGWDMRSDIADFVEDLRQHGAWIRGELDAQGRREAAIAQADRQALEDERWLLGEGQRASTEMRLMVEKRRAENAAIVRDLSAREMMEIEIGQARIQAENRAERRMAEAVERGAALGAERAVAALTDRPPQRFAKRPEADGPDAGDRLAGFDAELRLDAERQEREARDAGREPWEWRVLMDTDKKGERTRWQRSVLTLIEVLREDPGRMILSREVSRRMKRARSDVDDAPAALYNAGKSQAIMKVWRALYVREEGAKAGKKLRWSAV